MNNKKSIIALLIVAIVGVIGLTIAYFANEATIENEFNTNSYGTTVEEVFTSPDNWTPGTTTPKTLTVTNSGRVDEAVRVSYTESWTSKSAKDNNEEGDLALTQNGNRAAVINLSNNGDWEEVTENNNTYYYYKYKLAPSEKTSTLLDSVTFNSAITNDSTCTPSNNGQTVTCTSTGNSYDDATYKLTFHIETVQYDKYQEAWNTGNSVTIANTSKPQGVNFAQHIMSKSNAATVTNYLDGETTEAYTFEHAATAQTPALTDYRYIGASPNNYVEFNCDDNGNNCEVWRAIGVFYVDDGNNNWEWRVKLVRGSALPDTMIWDDKDGFYENSGINEWNGSLMQTFLNDNGDYYKKTGDAVNYGLKSTAKNMISNAKYYLGGINLEDNVATNNLYSLERGNAVFSYENYCLYNSYHTRCTDENYCENNPTDLICNPSSRNISWIGEIGLIYPSDYAYTYSYGVDEICYNDPNDCTDKEPWGGDKTSNIGYPVTGWIYNTNNLQGQLSINWNWFITPGIEQPNYVISVLNDGKVHSKSTDIDSGAIRPTLYLSSSVKATSGDGSVEHPYKLSL